MSLRTKRAPDEGALEEEERQYTAGGQTLQELDEKYPSRPRNHSRTLPFSELFKSLFNPLSENVKKPSGPTAVRARRTAQARGKLSPQEQRRQIIENFISRWRQEVGDDFYPALRLILPNSDRDRGVYGLKESNIGKLLVKVMKIDKNSEDGYNITHWKLPGKSAKQMAGDFAGRCYDVLSKRPIRSEAGNLRIAEVNELLDKLSAASGEKEQLPIFETFYQEMNPEEFTWLLRIILKEMKVGATDKTFLHMWHPDAEALFSVSSSLKRVCWELTDPKVRLEGEDAGVGLMQCFQPQLAQHQNTQSFQKMVEKLGKSNPSEDDDEFWIEEKLDGERMQLHMVKDSNVPGGRRFCFWSRKAKDYTYLYGSHLQDTGAALTRHLKDAFAPGVRNLILDGEMVTWDPETDRIMKFGTLKTAAIAEGRNPFIENGPRPVYKVFDILYLNDRPLTNYTLRDRRNALQQAVPGAPMRLEVHKYDPATSAEAIEPLLRKVIANNLEGLVLKNPRSPYNLNDRNDDWIKVKPDYMNEWGEEVDCVIIGARYGSGHRGGTLSSFLCGLRVTEDDIKAGANPEKCFSFVRVGGGFDSDRFAQIKAATEGKWHKWDPKNPPTEYIELAGGDRQQFERPDVWIRPSESVVLAVKASSSEPSTSFAKGVTLRFPRCKGVRLDRSWDSALDWQGFLDFKRQREAEMDEKKMTMEGQRRRPAAKRPRKDVIIAGQDAPMSEAPMAAPRPDGNGEEAAAMVFDGLEFCVLSDSAGAPKKTKTQLEALIKEHGGLISQRAQPPGQGERSMIIVADKKVVKVASLIKASGGEGGDIDIVRPRWVVDCLEQRPQPFLLPFERERHLFHASEGLLDAAARNLDKFGDSYARDLNVADLRQLLLEMPKDEMDIDGSAPFDKDAFTEELSSRGNELGLLKGHTFKGTCVHFALAPGYSDIKALRYYNRVKFGGGRVVEAPEDGAVSHVVVLATEQRAERELAAELRQTISLWSAIPRVVSQRWVDECWKNDTLLDEESYAAL